MIATSFLFFLLIYLAIGIYSSTRRKPTTDDYLLAGREMGPWMVALSAVSTANSGFMFIGLIGATYAVGLSSMWIMVGWVFGDYLAWRAIHQPLRERSERLGASSFNRFLGSSEDGESQSGIIRVAALSSMIFLGTYAGAQLTAGSKALSVLFGWDYSVGVLLGAGIVVAYCFAGGIRASIWTDAAQASVMFLAMFVLMAVALRATGGFSGMWAQLEAIDPTLTDWRPANLRYGFALYLGSWVAAGIGVLGQPHVMIRPMTIDSSEHIGQARRIYITYYSLFSAAAITVGLTARVLLPVVDAFDPELGLPNLAQLLLPDIMVGFILAGVFAATISTADSLILACSAALTQDLAPRWGSSYAGAKAGTLLVTAVVVLFVFSGGQSVFDLVVLSWSALGGTLGPLLALRALGRPVSSRLAITMMTVALAVMLLWRAFGDPDSIYEILPGILAGLVVYAIGRDRS